MAFLSSIQLIYLDVNSLSGALPLMLGSCPSLFDVDLSSNSLSGALPTSIWNLMTASSPSASTTTTSLALYLTQPSPIPPMIASNPHFSSQTLLLLSLPSSLSSPYPSLQCVGSSPPFAMAVPTLVSFASVAASMDNRIGILQIYSKEISQRMLTIKAKASLVSNSSPTTSPPPSDGGATMENTTTFKASFLLPSRSCAPSRSSPSPTTAIGPPPPFPLSSHETKEGKPPWVDIRKKRKEKKKEEEERKKIK